MKVILVLVGIYIAYKLLRFLFGHHHISGYTHNGLPIYPIGKISQYYDMGIFGLMKVEKDRYYPSEIWDDKPRDILKNGGYAQNIICCQECGKNFVLKEKL